MDKRFIRLYATHFFYIFAHVFGWTLASLYFVHAGYDFMDIALYFALSFITAGVVIMALAQKQRHFRDYEKLMQIGLILKMLIFLSAIFIFIKPMLFLVGVLHGIMTVFYWVSMNIYFFKFRSEGKNAAHSGSYFVMWPLLGALLPAFSGIAAEKYGMASVILIAAAIMVPAIILSTGIKQRTEINIDFRKFVENTKGLKTIIFLQGVWEGIDWIVVPLATLAFVPGVAAYGAFYAYLGFFGIVAFFLLARLSDKLKKRAVFLYPVTVLMAIATILSGFSSGFLEWGLYRGAVSFLVNLFSPFALTVVVDTSKNIDDSMISREFFLNFGRALGAAIVALMLAFSFELKSALIVSGAILLLHPLFLHKKKKHYHVGI